MSTRIWWYPGRAKAVVPGPARPPLRCAKPHAPREKNRKFKALFQRFTKERCTRAEWLSRNQVEPESKAGRLAQRGIRDEDRGSSRVGEFAIRICGHGLPTAGLRGPTQHGEPWRKGLLQRPLYQTHRRSRLARFGVIDGCSLPAELLQKSAGRSNQLRGGEIGSPTSCLFQITLTGNQLGRLSDAGTLVINLESSGARCHLRTASRGEFR